MSSEVREQLSSLPLDDENLHEAMRGAGEDPAALSADKSQVTLAFHPNIINAYSKLQSLQGYLRHVETTAAVSAEYKPRLLPEQVVKAEVRDLERKESHIFQAACSSRHACGSHKPSLASSREVPS